MKTKLALIVLPFLSLSPLARGQTNCTPPPAGLVGWWPGDGSANDRLGPHSGVLQGAAVANNAGLIGQAFTLDGTNAAVDFGNWFNLQTFSLSLWIKAGVTQQAYADIVDNNHTASRSWVVQYSNTNSTYGWGAAGIGSILFDITPGAWQHLAVTVDTNHSASLYLDGRLVGGANGTDPIAYDGTEFLRLGRWGGGGRFWNGQLDEVIVWNRALSVDEVAAIHAAGTNGVCNQVPPGFLAQPTKRTVPLGQRALFSTTAVGTQPLWYQWQLMGTNLPGATDATITLTGLQLSQAGNYQVVVTNAFGAVTSAVARLDVIVWTNGVFWSGGGDGASWSDANNWNGGKVPGTNDDVLIAAASPARVVYLGAQPAFRSLCNYEALWIQGSGARGNAILTASGDVTNRGTIVLDSTVWNCSATLTVGGTLLNAPEGVVQVNVGAGNSRSLNANVVNQGTINVASGISLYCIGAGKVFRQQAGTINGAGWFTWADGEFDFVGGSLSGAVYVRNGTLDVADTAGASTIYAAGDTTLLESRSVQATVWAQGNSSYGNATLTTAQGAVNAGTIHLESSVWNCPSVLVVGGSNLVNTATGLIIARNGAGSLRSITGDLINQGVVDGGDYYLDLHGTYEAAGGRMIGPARLRDAKVLVTASPPQPTTIDLWGGCTLLTDNLTNTVLYVHGGGDGNAVLTASGDVTNRGTIVLDSTVWNCSATLTVGGTLLNAPEGVVQVNVGAGNSRTLNANVINQGIINVAGGIGLYCNGGGKVFRQQAGSLSGTGWFTWADGEFDFGGGSLCGGVYVRNGTLDVASTAGASTIYAVGNTTFLANRSTQATVWVQGNSSYGNATLTTAEGAVNAGIIHLESSVFNCISVLAVGGSNLLNTATGLIVAGTGEGSNRSMTGYLINQGVVDGGDYHLDLYGTYEAAGGRMIGPARLRDAKVLVTASPPQPTTIDLWGRCTLLTDNLNNTVLYVHGGGSGNAVLSASGNVTNRGTIVLDSTAYNCSATLAVGGTLVNAPEGIIQVNVGAGNSRTLNANVVNQGTINVASGINLYGNGAGKVFRQEAGSINGAGWFTWADGEFDLVGGSISGAVYVRNGTLDVAWTAGATTIYAAGNTTLLENRSTQATVWVEGNSSYGHATLTTAQGAVNAGTIHLESSAWNCISVLVVGGSNLVNTTTGLISAGSGAGSARSINGYLANQGLVDGGDYYLDLYGAYEAAGGRMIGPARLRDANVLVTASPPQPTTIDLWGSCSLLTDNLANTVLYVHGGGSGNAVLTASGSVTNHGTIVLDSTVWNCSATLTVGGTLVNAPGGVVQIDPGQGNNRSLATELLNSGTVVFNYSASLGRTGADHRNTGAFRLAGATTTITGGSFFNQGTGEISGTGTLSCSGVNFQNSGSVSPGSSAGTLTFLGAYNQTADGQLNIEIGGLTASSQHDRLAISGNATLDGSLNVSLINDFLPAVSNSFRVLTCNSLSGQFAKYNGLVYYTNAALSPSYLANAVDLSARSATNAVIEAPRIVVQPQGLSVIQGHTATFRITANGTQPFAYQWLFNNDALTDATNTTLVLNNAQTNQAGLYAVRITNSAGAALSSCAQLTVRQVTDLIVADVTATNDAVAGQPIVVTWSSVDAGSAPANGPWAETVALSTNAFGTNPRLLARLNFTNNLVPGQSLVRTQSVILPAGLDGQYFVVVSIDTGNVIPEDIFETNNTCVSTQFVTIRAPDLIVDSLSAPVAAQFGQTIQAIWTVRNRGSADAAGRWNERLYLSSGSNSLQGATVLLTLSSEQPLAVGQSYTRTQAVVLPLSATLIPGSYFLVLEADSDGVVAESNEGNNLASSALALTMPPLPDLVVGSVSSPTQGLSGQSILVTWSVTNTGAAAALGPWRESVFLTNAAVGGTPALLLGSFLFTNNLLPGDALTRTQTVTIPLSGPAGDLRIAVFVDSEDSQFEQNEANNTALATNSLQVPLTLSLTVPTTNVSENTSAPILECLVSRNGDLSAPALVTLAGSAPSHLLVPVSVTIPAGATAAPFIATVLHDGVPGPDVSVTISAQASGFLGATSAVFVANTDLPRLALSLTTPQTFQGQTVVATVSCNPPGNQPIAVTIASSSPARLIPPSSVTIPANSTSVAFNLLAVDSTAIEPPHVYTITATAPGYVGASTNLTVINSHIPALTLTLDRTNVSESDGPTAVVGTVTRQPFGDQPLTIALTSTNPAAALVPAQVTIPAMEGAAGFFVAAVADDIVTGPKVTLISAQVLDASGNPVGSPAAHALVVQDDDGPTLKVLIKQKVVSKGLSPATTAVVWRNTPPTNDLVVVLTSNSTNAVSTPPTVTIAAGKTNAAFAIASLNDGATNTSQTVVITGSAPDFTSGSDQLVVTDFSLPDLFVPSITVPASASVGQPVTVTFRLANQGRGPLTNGVSQYVYLAPNSVAGSSSLAGTVFFSGPLAAGQYVDESVSIPASVLTSPGTFRVWVTADANGEAVEINKANNTAVSATSIVVSAEYSATVKAAVTNVLAGTPVPLSGSATLVVGGPAANKPVNILVTVRGFQRVLNVTTHTNGQFSTVFTPLPREAGVYTVAAVSPGVVQAPAQDQFTMVGMTVDPSRLSLLVIEGGHANSTPTLQNLGEVPLTGLTATVNGLAANLIAKTTLSTNTLAGQGSTTVACSVSANDATIRQSGFTVHLTSTEGAMLDLPVNVTVVPLMAQLAGVPAELSAAMLRGAQTIVQFDVVNLGGTSSGPLTVNLPSVPWLGMASTNPMPSLDPGASNRVTLVLAPAADLPLGPYSGSLALNSPNASATVGFQFLSFSDLKGHLRITAVDEYTYYAQGAPNVTNATVRLTDAASGQVVATTNTGLTGIVLLADLPEAYYVVEVSGDDHGSYKGSFFLRAGQMNELTAFLPRQSVRYYWTVEPTQIGDRARISIETVFETAVPAPVVTVEPNLIDLAAVTVSTQINLKISNHGLIAAKSPRLYFPQHPNWQFALLTSDLGDLPGLSSRTVPLSVTRLAAKTQGAGDCSASGVLRYGCMCGGELKLYDVPLAVVNMAYDCLGDGGFVGHVGALVAAGEVAYTVQSFASTANSPCAKCLWEWTKTVVACILEIIPGSGPLRCLLGLYTCNAGLDESLPPLVVADRAAHCALDLLECAGKEMSKTATGIATALGVLSCGYDIYETYEKCSVFSGGEGGAANDGSPSLHRLVPKDAVQDLAPFKVQLDRLAALIGPMTNLLGDAIWFTAQDPVCLSNWFAAFRMEAQTGSEAGYLISAPERLQLLAIPLCSPSTTNDVNRFIDRWNRTFDYYGQNIFTVSQVPQGWNTNFIARDIWNRQVGQAHDAILALESEGYTDPVLALQQTTGDLLARLSGGGGGICARVRLQLDQDAILTRDAFKATLEIANSTVSPLTNVSIQLVVRDDLGRDSTSLFGIRAPELSGLTGVDGNGVIGAQSAGKAIWTLIPTTAAAPTNTTEHVVSGTLQYVQDGTLITVPLAPMAISVLPNPSLALSYFHQRDVFADDPFTPQVEPSVPYSLAVMIQNRGYGTAHSLQIASAQPKIIENEKGLIIDFKIIGAQVGTQPVTPSLTVSLGDLGPGQTKIGRWLLTSSLQGLFTEYKASFEQVSDLGDKRLSLFDSIEIHEMTHLVQAERGWDDGLPDFLVNNVADVNGLPDTLYLSDSRIQPVGVVHVATTDGAASASHLQVQFAATFRAGFNYVRVPDPGNGKFTLLKVIRANGSQFRAENFWTTDRTFIGLGQRPIYENNLHLFDYHTNAGPDSYTLVYAAPATASQTNPPVSAVLALPPRSPLTFGVIWSGQSAVGQASVAYYDIFVSDNNGPFTIWQSHTATASALYTGSFGHAYAFYSVATDTAGNLEAPHATPDATTLVNLTNAPPTISFGGPVIVNEGETVRVTPTASDSDVPAQSLIFRLLGGAPPGAVVDRASGQLQWATGPGSGPATNVLGVVVTDNGFPPLSATGFVTLVIQQVIWPPVLAPIRNYTIKEGSWLVITNLVTDYNVPKRTYVFGLGPDTPTGASINPTNGLLTWMPSATQGPSTNLLTVRVTDTSLPTLSATQQFTVVVRDVLPDLVLGVGKTNLMAGESGVVPVTLVSTLDLTNLTFQFAADTTRLTNFLLRPAAIEVTSVALQPLGSNTYAASVALDPALQINATRTLAQLAFLAVSNTHSAIVPLTASPPLGLQSSGQAATNTSGLGGRVIVVATEPVLELAPGLLLTLYGHPGADYALEYRTNLVSSTAWSEFARLSLNNRFTQLKNLPAPGAMAFYRAIEVPSIGLGLQNLGGPVFRLTLSGHPDSRYAIQSTTNLAVPLYWSDLFTVTLTNSIEWVNWTNLGEPERLFRVISY